MHIYHIGLLRCNECGYIMENPEFEIFDMRLECPRCGWLLEAVIICDGKSIGELKCPVCGYIWKSWKLKKLIKNRRKLDNG